MSEERIQRILARAGVASRRKAEELIRAGRVTVNGQVAEIGGKADPERDAIKLDGKRVQPHTEGFRYLLLNKPKAVMSTVSDPEDRPTVMDYVPAALRKALVPVGRLDFNTEGLILLTDDGDFAQHVAHPRYGGVKVYEVKVKGRPSEVQLDRLRAGIPLEGRRTAPCRITPRYGDGGVEKRRARSRSVSEREREREGEGEGENSWWTVELTEGRTRQIREMFFRIGHGVLRLRRVAIGPLRDPDLPLGSVRELSETEVEKLRKATARPKRAAAKKAPVPRPAAKRAFPAPGTKKTDRSRPWRAEKPKPASAPEPAAQEKPRPPVRKAAAKRPAGRPPGRSRGKPSGRPAGRPSGRSGGGGGGVRRGRGR